MPESRSSHQMRVPPERSGRWRRAASDAPVRDELAQVVPRRARVSWWLAIVLALGFAAVVTPVITAERWLWRFQPGTVVEKQPAPFTVRAPMLAGYDHLRVGGGGVVVARGELATHDEATIADAIAGAMPRGPALYLALFALSFVLAAIFSHHLRRSNQGRLVRVQLVSLALIAVIAILAKALMLATALSALVVPVAVLAMIPTLVLDRVVGLATGVLAALVVSLLAPFDVGLAILLLVQAATAGLVIAERPKHRWGPALSAGLVTTLCTGAMYVLLTYLTTGHAPELHDPLHAAWLAAVIGPAIAAVVAVPLIPLYQRLVGEITQGNLFALEDLGHPLLRQIAERSPGTWQHSLMMANMAEIAANAIGASGRLVRVGAYFHDLGKSLSPKYFIENLEAGETSPHDQLPPEVSCDAIFAHVSEGIAAARKAGLHERIVDFMHMHHGNGLLEYFWARCRDQGNPHGYTEDQFRYPGHPPQSRETAILTICDAVEAASRTLKKPDAAAIDALVQRIVYGKLHLGQLDESGLSMSDLRRVSDSLRETIRHANHGRIEYPWQKPGAQAPGPAGNGARPSGVADTVALGRDGEVVDDASDEDTGQRPRPSDRAIAAVRGAKSGAVTREARALVETAPAVAPARDPAATLPGRAPGPSPDGANGRRRSDGLVRDGDDDPPLATTLVRDDPAAQAPLASNGSARAHRTREDSAERAPLIDGAARVRAATLGGGGEAPIAVVRDRGASVVERLPTREPVARDRAASVVERLPTREPTRTAGPPDPVDLENATTNPPPLRRTPSGQPAAPQDPAQIAAALAAIVSRVGDAPFGAGLGAAQPARRSGDAEAAVTQPVLAAAAALATDHAVTSPMLPAEPRPATTTHPKPSRRAITANPAPPTHLPGPAHAGDPDRDVIPILRTGIERSDAGPGAEDARITEPRAAEAPGDARVTATHDAEAADRFASSAGPKLDSKLDPLPEAEPSAGLDPAVDAAATEPSMPALDIGDHRRIDVPVRSVPRTVPSSSPPHRKPRWSSGLAARVDAAIESDEWGHETPVVAPSKAELRALTGHPDPTRQVPIDEIEILQRRAAELAEAESPRRAPHPTTEVDPDDIEAAIELAPPARRPTNANAIGAKPKKSE
jgi:cyclic-di-AMP phosphodiesterase PgpH